MPITKIRWSGGSIAMCTDVIPQLEQNGMCPESNHRYLSATRVKSRFVHFGVDSKQLHTRISPHSLRTPSQD
jgi:hypothetical protein